SVCGRRSLLRLSSRQQMVDQAQPHAEAIVNPLCIGRLDLAQRVRQIDSLVELLNCEVLLAGFGIERSERLQGRNQPLSVIDVMSSVQHSLEQGDIPLARGDGVSIA